jgi:prepilin signal peptidase PulO-like enzyme (type II secretory pathway)
MSICSPCTEISSKYLCVTSMFIGVGLPNTTYYVFFLSLANGWLTSYIGESDASGNIYIESESFDFAENTGYEFWVNTTNNSNDRDNFVNGIENTCFITTFTRID